MAVKSSRLSLMTMFIIYSVVIMSEGVEGACPSDWHSFEQDCYVFLCSGMERDRASAQAECETYGANLVSILSSEENAFIKGRLPGACEIWIGLSYTTAGGGDWSDGKGFWYNNAGADQPDQQQANGDSLCWDMYYYDGKWYDMACDSQLGFVCKKPAT